MLMFSFDHQPYIQGFLYHMEEEDQNLDKV